MNAKTLNILEWVGIISQLVWLITMIIGKTVGLADVIYLIGAAIGLIGIIISCIMHFSRRRMSGKNGN